MQNRIRQILEEQIMERGDSRYHYDGGYGTSAGAVKAAATRKRDIMKRLGGDAANKRAAVRSPWISYLKQVERDTGIPYNEAMVDPEIREMYHSGMGAYSGGKSRKRISAGKKAAKKNCWIKYEKNSGHKSSAGYKKYLKADKCVPNKSKYLSARKKASDLKKLTKAELIKLLK